MTKSFAHPGVKATEACANPPAWAVAERELLARLGTAVEPFLAALQRGDGHGGLQWSGLAHFTHFWTMRPIRDAGRLTPCNRID